LESEILGYSVGEVLPCLLYTVVQVLDIEFSSFTRALVGAFPGSSLATDHDIWAAPSPISVRRHVEEFGQTIRRLLNGECLAEYEIVCAKIRRLNALETQASSLWSSINSAKAICPLSLLPPLHTAQAQLTSLSSLSTSASLVATVITDSWRLKGGEGIDSVAAEVRDQISVSLPLCSVSYRRLRSSSVCFPSLSNPRSSVFRLFGMSTGKSFDRSN
jgi:hypothetical protein